MKIRPLVLMMALLLCFSAGCSMIQKDGSGRTPTSAETEHSPAVSAPAVHTPADTPHETEKPEASEALPVPSPSEAAAPPDEAVSLAPEPDDDDFVLVKDYIPSIDIDLKYATDDNITGQAIYAFSDAYLRYGTVKKLAVVQEKLSAQGVGLKIWDAFRPVQAQFALWAAYPDPDYVADPESSYSSHSRGNTIDVTLVRLDGTAVMMPTGFDVFSSRADRDYSDVDAAAAANALILETVMQDNGFTGYSKEWWHYSDTAAYPVEESFIP